MHRLRGSGGREGPIVQIGSAFGSLVGQVARVDERRLALLVARAAAGGISAIFNARGRRLVLVSVCQRPALEGPDLAAYDRERKRGVSSSPR